MGDLTMPINRPCKLRSWHPLTRANFSVLATICDDVASRRGGSGPTVPAPLFKPKPTKSSAQRGRGFSQRGCAIGLRNPYLSEMEAVVCPVADSYSRPSSHPLHLPRTDRSASWALNVGNVPSEQFEGW